MELARVDGTVWGYLRCDRSAGIGRDVRVEPDYAHVAPPDGTPERWRASPLVARFPIDIEPPWWAVSWTSARRAGRFRLHRAGGATVAIWRGTYAGRRRVTPHADLSMAIDRALQPVVEPEAPERLDAPHSAWIGGDLEAAARANLLDWATPLVDATGRRPPVWAVDARMVCRRAGFDPYDASLSRGDRLELIDRWFRRLDPPDSAGGAGPVAPSDLALREPGMDAAGGTDRPDPPVPPEGSIGGTLQIGGDTWTVVGAHRPVDDRRGWLYVLEDDDGWLSGLTQAGYEVHALGRSMGDEVPWRSGGETYGDLAGTLSPEWSRAHRRLHLESIEPADESIELDVRGEGGRWHVALERRGSAGAGRWVERGRERPQTRRDRRAARAALDVLDGGGGDDGALAADALAALSDDSDGSGDDDVEIPSEDSENAEQGDLWDALLDEGGDDESGADDTSGEQTDMWEHLL